MAIYLSDFDRPLAEGHSYKISLREQLIYTALTGETAIVSAASPFKNPEGFSEILRFKGLVEEGVIQFPLDARHDGKIERYISSRVAKLKNAGADSKSNPELAGYTRPDAEVILGVIDRRSATCERVTDCDATFRDLVCADTVTDDAASLNGILRSKKIVWGREDFMGFVRSKAAKSNPLFQRFDIINHAPREFVIDSVLRENLYRRMDELFYQANAISSGVASGPTAPRVLPKYVEPTLSGFARGYLRHRSSGCEFHNAVEGLHRHILVCHLRKSGPCGSPV